MPPRPAAGCARDDPAPRRSVLIELTPAGAGTIVAVIAREHGLLRGVDGEITAADVDACPCVLRSLHDTAACTTRSRPRALRIGRPA